MTPTQILVALTNEQWRRVNEAGRVMRWHTNQHMNRFLDTVEDHGQRCLIMVKKIFKRDVSENLEYEAEFHDYGEWKVGDIPGPAKAENPQLAEMVERIELAARAEIGLPAVHLNDKERKMLHLVDKLDAAMFVKRNNPAYYAALEWQEAQRKLLTMAVDLGKLEKVAALLGVEL